MATIVINSVGTLGDLNPFRLLAKQLVNRGHEVRFVTFSAYKEQLESQGIRHFTVRPDLCVKDKELSKKALDPSKGAEFLLENFIFPVRQTYEDLNAACDGADLIISGSLAYAASLIHETRKIPWISIALQASYFLSDHQFPVLPQAPWTRVALNNPALVRLLKGVFRFQVNQRSKEWFRLRKDLGLHGRTNILFDSIHSPALQLATYSPFFSGRQLDWPEHRIHTGFIQPNPQDEKLSPDLEKFLSEGEPPAVFTLGSAVVLMGERFFDTVLEVLEKYRKRAAIVCGHLAPVYREKARHLPHVFVTGAEPYSALFSRSSVIVHQGGIGTTAEALRSGQPMIVVPFGQDQYDNACHITRMGCGLWCAENKITPRKLRSLLRRVNEPKIRETSRIISRQIRRENGLEQVVRHVESLLPARSGHA